MKAVTAAQWDNRVLGGETRKARNMVGFSGVFAWIFAFCCLLFLAIVGIESHITSDEATASSPRVTAEINQFWRIFNGSEPQNTSAASRAAVALLKAVSPKGTVASARVYLSSLGPNSPLMSSKLNNVTHPPNNTPYADFESDTHGTLTVVDVEDVTSYVNYYDPGFLNDLRLYQEYGLGRVLRHAHTANPSFPDAWFNGWGILLWWLAIGQLAFMIASLSVWNWNRFGLPSRDENYYRWLWVFAPSAMSVAMLYCSRERWQPLIDQQLRQRRQRQQLQQVRRDHPDTFGDARWAQEQIAYLRRLPVQGAEVQRTIQMLERLIELASNVVPEQMSKQDGAAMARQIANLASQKIESLQTRVAKLQEVSEEPS